MRPFNNELSFNKCCLLQGPSLHCNSTVLIVVHCRSLPCFSISLITMFITTVSGQPTLTHLGSFCFYPTSVSDTILQSYLRESLGFASFSYVIVLILSHYVILVVQNDIFLILLLLFIVSLPSMDFPFMSFIL